MEIFGDLNSGNCLKVKYAADHLGRAYRWVNVDIMAGATHEAAFLAMSPFGQVPVVRFADGKVLAQSNAIIRYLAEGTALLPARAFERGLVDQWLFWEQNSHEPNIAVCRFAMVYLKRPASELDPNKVEKGTAALSLMDRHLVDRRYLVGDAISVADVSLLAYTRLAGEGGFSLKEYGALREWIARCEQDLGIGRDIEMTGIVDG